MNKPRFEPGNSPTKKLDNRLQLAISQHHQGKLHAARKQCQGILRKSPKHCEALQLMAILQQQTGNATSAMHFMTRALRSDPDNPQILQNLAELYRSSDDLERARHYAEKALTLAPDNIDALFTLAAVNLQQNKPEQAEIRFARIVVLNPQDAEAHNELGNLACLRHDYVTAINHYQRALHHRSGFDDCRINLADTLLQAGHVSGAILHYQKVLEHRPHDAKLHNRLGRAFVAGGETEQAKSCFELALEQNPLLLEARINLGRLCLDSTPRQAENWFKSTLDINISYSPGYYWLGVLFQTQGQFERASNYLQQACRIDPGHTMAWYRLSLDRSFVATDRQLDRLQTRLSSLTESGDQDEKVTLAFTLARFQDQRDNTELAFQHFRHANELKRNRSKFDPERHQAQVNNVIETFDQSFFNQRPDWGSDSEVPVFIVGMPRSGTTLVEQIIATHPAIHGAGELRLMLDFAAGAKSDKASTASTHSQRVAGLDSRQINDEACSYLEKLQTLSPQSQRIVDKLPGNYSRIGLIKLLFPRARIIHCLREPMDTCWSCYQQNFEQGLEFSNSLEHLGLVYQGYQRLMTHWQSLFTDQILQLRYENLVSEPEPVSRALLEYCGVEWDAAVLDHSRRRGPVTSASLWQARQPIYRSSVGRWKRYRQFLRPLETALFGATRPAS